eukprot:CAMPEP_0182561216 /NCGR_PEP_ID=MMETSP1324-20130603/3743_1 /TAXON_ID=236786 /ORGANISM="Florenciella sp., Strain RCC1587" /LENGTH=285 /DNA_ID=CAMNT_0024773775 /DNA_START=42 /DNA_END=899 /DNA_ORIENTATION=+
MARRSLTAMAVAASLTAANAFTAVRPPALSRFGARSRASEPAMTMVASIGKATDPGVTQIVAESSTYDFVKASALERAGATSVLIGTIATIGATDTVPEGLRLMLAAVGIFAQFEYCFHRWIMHSTDEKFAEYQSLHITHHVDTERDMTLADDAETDPRHIYFSGKTSQASVAICFAGLQALSIPFDLGFDPLSSLVASVLVACVHTSYWQTLHGDIHEYYEENPGGAPRFDLLSAVNPYTRWLITNHVGHHVIRGQGNYNIVFPGPDYLFGTCFVPLRSDEGSR